MLCGQEIRRRSFSKRQLFARGVSGRPNLATAERVMNFQLKNYKTTTNTLTFLVNAPKSNGLQKDRKFTITC